MCVWASASLGSKVTERGITRRCRGGRLGLVSGMKGGGGRKKKPLHLQLFYCAIYWEAGARLFKNSSRLNRIKTRVAAPSIMSLDCSSSGGRGVGGVEGGFSSVLSEYR